MSGFSVSLALEGLDWSRGGLWPVFYDDAARRLAFNARAGGYPVMSARRPDWRATNWT